MGSSDVGWRIHPSHSDVVIGGRVHASHNKRYGGVAHSPFTQRRRLGGYIHASHTRRYGEVTHSPFTQRRRHRWTHSPFTHQKVWWSGTFTLHTTTSAIEWHIHPSAIFSHFDLSGIISYFLLCIILISRVRLFDI